MYNTAVQKGGASKQKGNVPGNASHHRVFGLGEKFNVKVTQDVRKGKYSYEEASN